jgi:hypothetical protein
LLPADRLVADLPLVEDLAAEDLDVAALDADVLAPDVLAPDVLDVAALDVAALDVAALDVAGLDVDALDADDLVVAVDAFAGTGPPLIAARSRGSLQFRLAPCPLQGSPNPDPGEHGVPRREWDGNASRKSGFVAGQRAGTQRIATAAARRRSGLCEEIRCRTSPGSSLRG